MQRRLCIASSALRVPSTGRSSDKAHGHLWNAYTGYSRSPVENMDVAVHRGSSKGSYRVGIGKHVEIRPAPAVVQSNRHGDDHSSII